MGESAILYTPGSGGKAHGYQRTIGANAVDESVVIVGEQYLASYVALGSAVSIATSNDHILQLMAGSSLYVRIRRIYIVSVAAAASPTNEQFQVWRLTSAGSGGSAVTPAQMDNGDNPSGATAQTLPSAKGTEGTLLFQPIILIRSADPTNGGPLASWEWTPQAGMKPLIIAAGTSNGIAIKALSGRAGATCTVWIEYTESTWL